MLAVTSETNIAIEARPESMGEAPGPLRFITWNLNGLAVRMKKGDVQRALREKVGELRPDIIALQEVRLECEEGSPSQVKRGSSDEACWEKFIAPFKQQFHVYLSLSSQKYGGQAVLVRKTLATPIVSYNMAGAPGHFKSGRFVRLDVPDMIVRSVYAPFNGAGKQAHYTRRQGWDALLREEMRSQPSELRARVLMGDLNVVNKDSDISGNPEFWKQQGDQSVAEGTVGLAVRQTTRGGDSRRSPRMGRWQTPLHSHWTVTRSRHSHSGVRASSRERG